MDNNEIENEEKFFNIASNRKQEFDLITKMILTFDQNELRKSPTTNFPKKIENVSVIINVAKFLKFINLIALFYAPFQCQMKE